MSPSALPTENGDAPLDIGLVPNPNPTIVGPWTVEKVLETIPTGKPAEGTSSPIGYFHLLERLKTTKREGWRRFGINRYVSPTPVYTYPPTHLTLRALLSPTH
jgi:putative hydrolase of HD superfamily